MLKLNLTLKILQTRVTFSNTNKNSKVSTVVIGLGQDYINLSNIWRNVVDKLEHQSVRLFFLLLVVNQRAWPQ